MNSTPPAASLQARVLVWWVMWGAILTGLIVLYTVFGRVAINPVPAFSILGYAGLLPLLVSSLLRWIVLPHARSRVQAFVLFIFGLALAESCGVLGIFLTGQRETMVILAALGVLQWMPRFALRYEQAAAAGTPAPEPRTGT